MLCASVQLCCSYHQLLFHAHFLYPAKLLSCPYIHPTCHIWCLLIELLCTNLHTFNLRTLCIKLLFFWLLLPKLSASCPYVHSLHVPSTAPSATCSCSSATSGDSSDSS